MKSLRLAAAGVALGIVTVAGVTAAIHDEQTASAATSHTLEEIRPAYEALGTGSGSVIGAYVSGVPNSVNALTSFQSLTSTKLRVVMYYSGWGESFQASFANTVGRQHIIPLVQIRPTKVTLPEITDGSQDGYLYSYANAIHLYGRPVILSFGPEMNGSWYPWGYEHTSPSESVAAWRHIVKVFRAAGANNITWLWTVSSTAGEGKPVANPDAWWPGSEYVTWVGVDGYYYRPNETFTTLFDPTIADIRKVTGLPILIAATGAAPQAGQAAKIANLLAGVKANRLLGFVWFDAKGSEDWRIDTSAAIVAFRVAASKT